jgi:type VI secretion system protein ImpF
MAELTPLERLQPALLDRLSDDAPDTTQEPREARLITRQKLRAAVLRDLSWLLNATRPGEGIDWDGAPHAERSVLNYGLPALSGETASTLDVTGLEQRIRRAIVDFEPRIDPSSLRVQATVNQIALDHHNQIQLEIHGNLWSQPVPIELLLRTAVDLETGQVEIEDLHL